MKTTRSAFGFLAFSFASRTFWKAASQLVKPFGLYWLSQVRVEGVGDRGRVTCV